MGNACCTMKNPNTLDLGPKTTKEMKKKAKKNKSKKDSVPNSAMELNYTPQNSSRTGSIVNEMNLENKREATIED